MVSPLVKMTVQLSGKGKGKGESSHLRTAVFLTVEQAMRGIRAFVLNAEGVPDEVLTRHVLEGRTITDSIEEAGGRMVSISFRLQRQNAPTTRRRQAVESDGRCKAVAASLNQA